MLSIPWSRRTAQPDPIETEIPRCLYDANDDLTSSVVTMFLGEAGERKVLDVQRFIDGNKATWGDYEALDWRLLKLQVV